MNKPRNMEPESSNAYRNFMKYIREYRISSGLTQQEMAKVFDISMQHISNLENDKYYPTFDRMLKMFKTVNKSVFHAQKLFKIWFPEYVLQSIDIKQADYKKLQEENERLKKVVDKLLES